MHFAWWVFYSVFILILGINAASATLNVLTGDVWDIYDDVVIDTDTYIDFEHLNINESVSIRNMGHINASINICDNCVVYLQNSGLLYGNFNFESGAKLIQVIENTSDITDIGINAPVLVQNANMIKTSAIASTGTDSIILDNATLLYDGVGLSNVDFADNVIVYINDTTIDTSNPIITNIDNAAGIQIHALNYSPLFSVHTDYIDKDVFAMIVRETDYAKILQNNTGKFLNILRQYESGDKLFTALDSAGSMDQLYSIMDASVKLNPINLMNPVRLFNRMETLFPVTSIQNGFSTSSIFMSGKGFDIYGARAFATGAFERIQINIGGYIGVMDYADSINEYMAMMYGANIAARYDINDVYFARALAGITGAMFDAGMVLGGTDDISEQPLGHSLYGALDMGMKMDLLADIHTDLFVGLDFDNATILGNADLDLRGRIGADISYDFEALDIQYSYGMGFRMSNNLFMGAGVYIGFFAPWDCVGGMFRADVMQYEHGFSYRIGIDATLSF